MLGQISFGDLGQNYSGGNKPTRATSNEGCSIPLHRTANRSASGSARIRGRLARARHFTWCAPSAASLWRRPPESGDKLTRFGPFSSQCRAGNVTILRGAWNENLFRVLEGFPDLAHDDDVDACSGALEMLNPQMKGWAIFELYRQTA